ncbi:MAG TPA: DNA polymerase III subunit delta' [Myxococcales bacterium]|nr:DNA polymerase III subunit delta' [Myxococcales bacterium]
MPWNEIAGQSRAVRLLRGALERGQPHHAYLLAGPRGVGKELLARVFAQAANCDAGPEQRPCGTCSSCSAIARGIHPDVAWVMPQSEAVARGLLSRADVEGTISREIRVDEVRALSRRLALAAARGRRKIAVLVPADALNERAQNTLLKTLEEPPPATTFLLVTEQPDALLATVRSRCARVQVAPLPEDILVDLLVKRGAPPADARRRAARAEGSAGRALDLDDDELDRRRELVERVEAAVSAPDERDALDLAESAGERDAAARVASAVHAWTRDLLVTQAGLPVQAQELSTLAGRASAVPAAALLSQASLCAEVIEALEQNGNGRLQLERLLLGMRELRNG